ncbi:MAG: hypothetical protein GY754_09095 [bacterium]|nr:hypothetical protein [bacterium]
MSKKTRILFIGCGSSTKDSLITMVSFVDEAAQFLIRKRIISLLHFSARSESYDALLASF